MAVVVLLTEDMVLVLPPGATRIRTAVDKIIQKLTIGLVTNFPTSRLVYNHL